MEERRREGNIKRLWEECGLPKHKRAVTLDTLNLDEPATAAMVQAAREFIEHPWPPFLALMGSNGNGKSHAAMAIVCAAIEQEIEAYYAYSPHFVEQLQKGQFTGKFEGTEQVGRDYFDLMEKANKAQLLVIDDFGLYKETPWADVQMDKIVGWRYFQELPTVITTNVKLAAMPIRLRSRLTDDALCRIVVNNDRDYRKKR